MSINHHSSDLPETQWWSHYIMDSSTNHKSFISTSNLSPNSTANFWLNNPNHHHLHRTAAVSLDLNNEDDEEYVDEKDNESEQSEEQHLGIPKQPLFEKPLTPSDVGKLNRLVIPKQHAEKHFPLNGGGGGGDAGENGGLLLGFEDEVGKSWRFRYSYWNSSQSYVLTKGWSRFVKEKRLDAGDIVVFARHRVDAGRLFIGWRRRNNSGGGGQDSGVRQPAAAVASGGGGGGGWNRVFYSGQPYQGQYRQGPSSLSYQTDQCPHAGSVVSQNQTTAAASSGNPKRLRLFGVNLECHQTDESSEPSTPVGSPMSSQGQAHHHPYQYYSNNHMDISFSGAGVYRQG